MGIPTNFPVVYSEASTAFIPNSFERAPNVSDNTYDALLGLLEKRTVSKLAAQNLASNVIAGLVDQGVDINNIIDRLRLSLDTEIDAFLAFFLNRTRVGTSYLGVSNRTTTNPYITRTILP